LCGSGVTSSIESIRKPACCNAAIADSRPEPGPLTLISTSRTPLRIAALAHRIAACWAANGVLLRDPLKPTQPAELEQIASPLGSVIVISVLLNVALMCTTALAMFFRIFFLTTLAIKFPEFVVFQYSSLTDFLYALLARNSLSRALAGTGISTRTLPANRQTLSMPKTSVAVNVAQPPDVLSNLSPELSSNYVVTVDNLRYPAKFVFSKLAGFRIIIDFGFLQNFFRCVPA
jgi:hypothetical protein